MVHYRFKVLFVALALLFGASSGWAVDILKPCANGSTDSSSDVLRDSNGRVIASTQTEYLCLCNKWLITRVKHNGKLCNGEIGLIEDTQKYWIAFIHGNPFPDCQEFKESEEVWRKRSQNVSYNQCSDTADRNSESEAKTDCVPITTHYKDYQRPMLEVDDNGQIQNKGIWLSKKFRYKLERVEYNICEGDPFKVDTYEIKNDGGSERTLIDLREEVQNPIPNYIFESRPGEPPQA